MVDISLDQCSPNLTKWRGDPFFWPDKHETSKPVNMFHQNWLRFGKSNDLRLFIEDDSESGSYINGLFATSILTGVFLLLWGFLIIYFSCRRSRNHQPQDEDDVVLQYQKEEKENILLGNPFVKSLPPRIAFQPRATFAEPTLDAGEAIHQNETLREQRIKEYNRDYRRHQRDYYRWKAGNTTYKRRIVCTRITVIVGCLIIITASTLFYIHGADQVSQLGDTSRDNLEMIQEKAQQGIDVIQEFLTATDNSNATAILDKANTFCPSIRPRICNDMETQTSCNWSGIPYGASIRNWGHALIHIRDDVSNQMRAFQSDLHSSVQEVDQWLGTIDQLQRTLSWSTGFVFFLDVLCLYILVGVLMAWCKIRNLSKMFLWIRSFCLIPVFVAAVLFSWMFAMVFVVGSLTTSDFCFEGPDEKVIALMGTNPSLSPMLVALIQHFVTGCSNAFVPDVFTDEIDQLVAIVQDAGLLLSTLRRFDQHERDLCGPFSLRILTEASTMAQEELCSATARLQDTRVLFGCSVWNPMYTNLAYDTLCEDTMDAFAWITISQCVIVFVAMVILTFRVTILPVMYVRWHSKSKPLSRRVSADLKRISDLAAAASKQRIDDFKFDPVYVLTYSDDEDSTERTVSDYVEGSTTEQSNSESEHVISGILPLHMPPVIEPRLEDDQSSTMSETHEPPESMMTILASNKIAQAPRSLEEDSPVLLAFFSEPQESIVTVATSNMTEAASRDFVDAPPSREKRLSEKQLPIPAPIEEETPIESSAYNVDGEGGESQNATRTDQRVLPSFADDLSYEEVTYRSESEDDEETLVSMVESSNSQIKRDSNSLADSLIGSSNSRSQSKKSSLIRNPSIHSKLSGSFRSTLANVAEEGLDDSDEFAGEEGSLVAISQEAQHFQDGDRRKSSKNDVSVPGASSSDISGEDAGPFSLRLDFGKFNIHSDSASSLGASFDDLTLKSDSKSLQSLVESEDPVFERSEGPELFDVAAGQNHKTVNQNTKSAKEANVVNWSVNANGTTELSPKSVALEEDKSNSVNATWNSSLRSPKPSESFQAEQEDSSACHYMLNLDLDTFHSTDFGDFSTTSNASGNSFGSFGHDAKEEKIIPKSLSTSPHDRSESSLSSPSLDNLDEVEIASTDSKQSSINKSSFHKGAAGTSGGQKKPSITKSLTGEHENGRKKPDRSLSSGPVTISVTNSTDDDAQIDISLLQKRADSMRSLNDSGHRMTRSFPGAKEIDISLLLKQADSKRSLVSADSSVAISTASSTEIQYYLEDDMGMASNSFSAALLPSRAIDSEMLAVVDETWTEDNEDEGITPFQSNKYQMTALVQQLGSPKKKAKPDLRKMPSERSMKDQLNRSSEHSMTDPFNKSVDLSTASSTSFQYYLNDSMAPPDGIKTMAVLPKAIDSEILDDLEEESSLHDHLIVSPLEETGSPESPPKNNSPTRVCISSEPPKIHEIPSVDDSLRDALFYDNAEIQRMKEAAMGGDDSGLLVSAALKGKEMFQIAIPDPSEGSKTTTNGETRLAADRNDGPRVREHRAPGAHRGPRIGNQEPTRSDGA